MNGANKKLREEWRLRISLEKMLIKIEYVDEIPAMRSGKRKPVVCE
jgi:hypothetical protein